MFVELEGTMIRPAAEAQNRLTHIVFPDTILAIPGAGSSFRKHSDRSFPQARLLADAGSDVLYAKVSADLLTDNQLTERRTIFLTMDDVFFNTDIWNYFSEGDKKNLQRHGFGPGQTAECWAGAIRRNFSSHRDQFESRDRVITVNELPININQNGSVGTLNSFHNMPGTVIRPLLENHFTEDGEYYEIGSAHIHPEQDFRGIAEQVALRIGERKMNLTVSPPDVAQVRSSEYKNKVMLEKYDRGEKKTGETFVTIVGVDRRGNVNDIQHHDFNLVDNPEAAIQLNERTMDTLKSSNPDIGLIVEHYELFSDPRMTSKELGGEVGEHVGLR